MGLHGADHRLERLRQACFRRQGNIDLKQRAKTQFFADPLFTAGGEGEAMLAHQHAALFQFAAHRSRDRQRQACLARGIRQPAGFAPMHGTQQRLDARGPFAKRGRFRHFLQDFVVQNADILVVSGLPFARPGGAY